MTYKEKMDKEHPAVDPDFVLFSCPGHYFEDAPDCNHATCPGVSGVNCVTCWGAEIPELIPEIPEPTPEVSYHNYATSNPSNDFTFEIPSLESAEKTLTIDEKKIAARVKEIYKAFRDEDLNHQEAFELTKIIIAEEVHYEAYKTSLL